MNSWPATNITAAKAKASIADASWGTSFIVRRSYRLCAGLLNCPSFSTIPEGVCSVFEAAMKKGPDEGPFLLITVVMDYGFALVPVTMLFLNHSGAVTIRFTLLDNRAIAITITIMAFANSHAGTHGASSNSNFVRQSWRRNGSYGSNHQSVLHSCFLQFRTLGPNEARCWKFPKISAKEPFPFNVGIFAGNTDP
jgi:hypothetical protein